MSNVLGFITFESEHNNKSHCSENTKTTICTIAMYESFELEFLTRWELVPLTIRYKLVRLRVNNCK